MTRRTSITELEGAEPTGRERVLVNFFYAPNVGHAVEALHYCLGHYLAGLGRIIAAADELLCGSVTYERALKEYFTDLLSAHWGQRSAIWSIDNVHLDYV